MREKSNKNNESLINIYKQTKSDLVLEKIIKKYKEMCYHLINNYYNVTWEFDKVDYYQMIVMKYPSWIMKFDETKNISFSTYMYSCTKNYLLNLIRKENVQKRKVENKVYFESCFNGTNGVYADIIRDESDFENTYLQDQKYSEYKKIIKTILGEDTEIYLLNLEGHSIKEIAKIINLDEKKVRHKLAYQKQKIRKNKKLFQDFFGIMV